MKQTKKPAVRSPLAKLALVASLYAGAALISCSGVLFLVYSMARNIRINIFSLSIPGYILALLMLFFGVRSFITVRKFSQSVLKDTPRLSLSLFKARPAKSKSV